MESVCEEPGPPEPSKVSYTDLKCFAITDIQTEGPERPAITQVQKEVADGSPAGSETSKKVPSFSIDERTTGPAPKQGNTSNGTSYITFRHCHPT